LGQLRFSKDGSRLALLGPTTTIWNTKTWKVIGSWNFLDRMIEDRLMSVELSPELTSLVTLSRENSVITYDALTGKRQKTVRLPGSAFLSGGLYPSPDKDHVYLIGYWKDEGWLARVIDLDRGRVTRGWKFPEQLQRVILSPDGLYLGCTTNTNELCIW